MLWYVMVCYGYGMGMVWYVMGMVWYGMVWYGMVCYGMLLDWINMRREMVLKDTKFARGAMLLKV